MSDQFAPFRLRGGTTDITPTQPVPLAGYSGRQDSFKSVADRLEANAILLESGARRVLFVSVDVLFLGKHLTDAITAQAARFGLSSDQVVLAASHTHFAPAVDDTKPLLGTVDDDYIRFAKDRLVQLVERIMSSSPADVVLEFSRVRTSLNVGRRLRWLLPVVKRSGLRLPPTAIMAPNVDAERDPNVDVVRAVDGEGNVKAVFWKFAAHPVCFPEIEGVSAEYPGRARERLRHQLRGVIPVVFWQGFAGDVRPTIGVAPRASERAVALLRRRGFSTVNHDGWAEWADAVADKLVVGTAAAGQRLVGPLSVVAHDLPMPMVLDPEANPLWRDRNLRMQLVSFGAVDAVFIAAEVCSPYLRTLASETSTTIFVGYVGDVFGYLPSAEQALEGGYEGRDFFQPFGLDGGLQPNFEHVICSAVAALRRSATASPGLRELPVEGR